MKVRFPSLGPNKGAGNPQGPVGFDYKTSTGLEKTKTMVLEGTLKALHAARFRGKEP